MINLLRSLFGIWHRSFVENQKPSQHDAPSKSVMLILRGISGTFGGKNYPHGALDEASALAYAEARGYDGRVLDVSGETGQHSAQTNMAVDEIEHDERIAALYGFSGGGYNVRHILGRLSEAALKRIKLVVVLGAPKNSPNSYGDAMFPFGDWELIYRNDPPDGHMAGPRVLLKDFDRGVA